MSFSYWTDLGFTDLLPIIPPGAKLSEGSKVSKDMLGKIPGILGSSGWYSYDWMSTNVSAQTAKKAEANGAGIGIRASSYPAIDIDVTDAELSEAIQEAAFELVGHAPVRIGRAPKSLLQYRSNDPEAPLGRRRLRFLDAKGTSHLVEFLGHGQQYVIEGTHAVTGNPYRWDTELNADDLTVAEPEKVDKFFSQLHEILELIGCTIQSDTGRTNEGTVSHVQENLLAPSTQELAELLDRLPNTNEVFPTRDSYVLCAHAAKAAGALDEEPVKLAWMGWALRWGGNDHADANTPEDAEADWERCKPPYRVGWDKLTEYAAQAGLKVDDSSLGLMADCNEFAPVPRQLPDNFDPKGIKRRPWVMGTRFLRGAVTGGIGAPGVSKSTFSLMSALAIVTGREDLTKEVVHCTGPVWVHNNEDDEDEMMRRIAGICSYYSIDFKSIRAKLFFSSGAVKRLTVAAKKGDLVTLSKSVDEIIATVRGQGIVFMAVDPFVSTHDGVGENSNEDVEKVLNAYRKIAADTGCAIDLVHHSVKTHSGNVEGRAGDMNAARGASAFIGAVRVAYTISGMNEDTAEKYGIPPEEAPKYVRLDPAKGNYSPRSNTPRWFELLSVDLGNDGGDLNTPSDSVGVPVWWDSDAAIQRAEDAKREAEEAKMHKLGVDLVGFIEAPGDDFAMSTCQLADVRDRAMATGEYTRDTFYDRVKKYIPLGADNGAVVTSPDGVVWELKLALNPSKRNEYIISKWRLM